jgi:hypothetical protein
MWNLLPIVILVLVFLLRRGAAAGRKAAPRQPRSARVSEPESNRSPSSDIASSNRPYPGT